MSSSWHDLKKSSQPSLPSLVVNTDVYRDTLSGRHGRSVWGPSLALATVGLLPVLASVCVNAWVITEWKFFCACVCVFDLFSLLPAKHQVWPNHYKCCYALRHSGAISLILYAVWFGLRVASDQSEVMIWHAYVILLLWYCTCILSLLWMNWLKWCRILHCDLLNLFGL